MNAVFLEGNLTRDVEIRDVGTSQVAKFGLAHNRRFKKGEEWVEETMFINCEAWGYLAKRAAEDLAKGDGISLQASLHMDEWEKDGERKTAPKLKVEWFKKSARFNKQESEQQPETPKPAATRGRPRKNTEAPKQENDSVPF